MPRPGHMLRALVPVRIRALGIIAFLMIGVLSIGLAGADLARAEELLRVPLGSHTLVKRDRTVERIALGDPEIADVEAISAHEVLILGRKVGRTSLILWYSGTSEQISLLVEPVADRDPPDPLEFGENELYRSESGALQGRARTLPGLAAVHPADGVDASELGFDTQVQINIKIVEVSRQALKQIGVQLLRNTRGSAQAISPPGSLSGISGAGAGVKETFEGFVFGSQSGFLPLSNAFQLVTANSHSGFVGILSLLESEGFAHTLAEPTLVATSGRTASFLAGGEFPIPVSQGGNAGGAISIEYREFGIRVSLRPVVLSRNHIVVEVAPEVSDLDFSGGISIGGVAVPALTTRRAETTIELGDGESFIIGGLVSRTVMDNVERIPGLENLPILGNFFRRTRQQRSDRELVMVVSPRLVRPLRSELGFEDRPIAPQQGAPAGPARNPASDPNPASGLAPGSAPGSDSARGSDRAPARDLAPDRGADPGADPGTDSPPPFGMTDPAATQRDAPAQPEADPTYGTSGGTGFAP